MESDGIEKWKPKEREEDGIDRNRYCASNLSSLIKKPCVSFRSHLIFLNSTDFRLILSSWDEPYSQ